MKSPNVVNAKEVAMTAGKIEHAHVRDENGSLGAGRVVSLIFEKLTLVLSIGLCSFAYEYNNIVAYKYSC